MNQTILQIAAELERQGRSFVLATVVGAAGRTPRDPGARMIWLPGPLGSGLPEAGAASADSGVCRVVENAAGAGAEGGVILGTVGGGRMEQMVIEACRERFAKRSSGVEHLVLKEDADQCCGGTMDVFIEFIGRVWRVVIFGAGHVSAALARLLAESAIEVVVVDDRAEWNSAERFPGCRRIGAWEEGLSVAAERRESTSVCIMTYDHDRDFALLRGLLGVEGAASSNGAARLPAYLGLIGSRSKRACFFGRLTASGLSDELISRVECPMGLGDMGKSPLEVAVSIAGRLLLEAKTHDRAG